MNTAKTATIIHALVLQHMDFADKIAYSKKKNLPSWMDIEETKSCAYMGLVEAANRYDPEKGSFTTFAYPRITGAIIDYLRELGTPLVSLDSQYEDDGYTLAKTIPAPEEPHVEEIFEEMTLGLDNKAQDVLRCYLLDDMPMKEVGHKLGVTESRVSQLITGYKEEILSRWKYEELAA